MTLSLQRQIDAVRLEIMGITAQRKIRQEGKRPWPETEYARMEVRIMELEAVVRTLEWLQANEQTIKKRVTDAVPDA